jgi:glycosyltransferase involved in cell wall biosynthesis
MSICLNMIVKNEAARITRALDSVAQFIDCYAIVDTGSDDETPNVIKEYFLPHKIPGTVSHAPFKNWSQARNAALVAARAVRSRYGWDWALLTDADMTLVMKDLPAFQTFLDAAKARGALSIEMEQRGGAVHYANKRLISSKATGLYRGVTHEYLDVDSGGSLPASIAYFDDHADGANRPEKYKRDIRLLLEGLKDEPDNYRYYYYLAQSYRDGGDIPNAKLWYKKRVAAGGWIEEQWSAQVNYANCLKDEGDEAGFVREMLLAYNMRPSRAEALYDLAHYFRLKDDKQHIAALFAEVGMAIPPSKDLLFVNNYVYEVGLKEEFAITGYYNEQKRAKAFQVCSDLSLQPGPYPQGRETGRSNLYWYIKPLSEYCPSFKWRKIAFEPPADWVALNPSVTNHGVDQRLYCSVRCVNYRIDDQGRYLIRGTDGTANNSNPINTRNFLLDLGYEPLSVPHFVREIAVPPDLPCEFPPVIGFEDLRLFSHSGELWSSSTVRQIHWDGNCEQVVARVADVPGGVQLVEWKRMLRTPRETEKNWAPIPTAAKDETLWMWRPGVTINSRGEFVHNNPPPLTTDVLSGGSQLVPCDPFLVALVHTARQIPGSPCRYYYHRWIAYSPIDFRVASLSLPFVFHDRVIEFAAGLAQHPTDPRSVVISYGYQDNEARVATIKKEEIMRMMQWTFK